MRNYRVIGALVSVAIVAMGSSVSAQSELGRFDLTLEQIERDSRLLVDPDVPLDQRAVIDFGAYTSFFFAAIDDPQNHTHILRLTDFNAYARINVDGVHQAFVRGRASYFDWNTGEDLDGEGDEWRGPNVERAVYRFDLKRAIAAYQGENVDYNIIAQGGRQLVHWGNGLVLSREIDGGVVTGEVGGFELQFMGGRTFRDQVDFDSSRPGFNDHTHRWFYGGMLSYDLKGHRPYIYGLVQEDDNGEQTVPGIIGFAPDIGFGYDSYYVGGGITGPIGDRLIYGLEAVHEGGEGLSNQVVDPAGPPFFVQTQEEIDAWAFDARLDFLCGDSYNSRLSGELLMASGDDRRGSHTSNTLNGNQPGTDDEAFNGFGLINTGLAFAPNVSNLIMLRGGASTFPLEKVDLFERLQVGFDVFGYFRTEDDGPIHETTDLGHDGSYLGWETDIYANWQVTSDLAVVLRYGVFFPGSALEVDLSGDDQDKTDQARHFFFAGVTLAY